MEMTRGHHASEAEALADIGKDGFVAEAKGYAAGKTEPHCHDYDVFLHVLEGEFTVSVPEDGAEYSAGPGDRLFVPAGTVHSEDHGPVRLVIGRRPGGRAG